MTLILKGAFVIEVWVVQLEKTVTGHGQSWSSLCLCYSEWPWLKFSLVHAFRIRMAEIDFPENLVVLLWRLENS
jgi:hypothetical protein